MATNDAQDKSVQFGVRIIAALALAALLVALFFPTERIEMNPLLILILGVALIYVGYGPLSAKKNPTVGVGFATIGFLLRLTGALLLVWDVLLWIFVISMILPPRMR